MPFGLEDVAFHGSYIEGEVDAVRLDIHGERARDKGQ